MSTTWFIFYLCISFIKSQRVTLFSWSFETNPTNDGWSQYETDTNGWTTMESDSNRVTSSNCPGAPSCQRMSGNDELYITVTTIGYTDIQIGYDIRTSYVVSGNQCEFWYSLTNNLPWESGWFEVAKHTNTAPQSVLHTSFGNILDNSVYLSMDFWADMSATEYCYINNVYITGIVGTPPTSRPTNRPSLLMTSFSPKETNVMSQTTNVKKDNVVNEDAVFLIGLLILCCICCSVALLCYGFWTKRKDKNNDDCEMIDLQPNVVLTATNISESWPGKAPRKWTHSQLPQRDGGETGETNMEMESDSDGESELMYVGGGRTEKGTADHQEDDECEMEPNHQKAASQWETIEGLE